MYTKLVCNLPSSENVLFDIKALDDKLKEALILKATKISFVKEGEEIQISFFIDQTEEEYNLQELSDLKLKVIELETKLKI